MTEQLIITGPHKDFESISDHFPSLTKMFEVLSKNHFADVSKKLDDHFHQAVKMMLTISLERDILNCITPPALGPQGHTAGLRFV